ncbi:MAG: hypothetical protein AB1705_11105 [Verrucomicrobiota bacterium]
MMKGLGQALRFQLQVGGQIQNAELRFATQTELRRYHRSLTTSARDPDQIVRDAVEFTRLAAKRWRYYENAGEAAETVAQLQRAIHSDARCEIAFIMIATTKLEGRRAPVGLAYCRRTWCHHLALDFLALHPRSLGGESIAGVGSGIIYGLVQLAESLGIDRIWGEATAHSASFYEKLLELRPVLDLFLIDARGMAAIRNRQAKLQAKGLAAAGPTGL